MQLVPKWTWTEEYEPVVIEHGPKGVLDMENSQSHHSDTRKQKSTMCFAMREASSLLKAK